jgi:alpha-L-fucosidase
MSAQSRGEHKTTSQAESQGATDYTAGYRDPKGEVGNDPARLAWFRGLGLGMFVHWGVDVQLGSVISHSLVGASAACVRRYFTELPQFFEPRRFDAEAWARIAKRAGMRYMVFTAKHHSGFCMFETETTDFCVSNTPYGRDVVAQVVEACRTHGIAVGLYFSPDDFWLLHQQGHPISRLRPEALPSNNPELMAHNRRQLRELLTQYGSIDLFFLDGEAAGLRELCWEMQPDTVVTRGAMPTPEQRLPDEGSDEPWEACFTMGTQWQFKPTNESYKTGTKLIEMLIETRAKGGNLLVNVGPTPDGEIPFEQERLLRELALWLFVNGEAIYDVEPWHTAREADLWFTRARDEETVYVFVTGVEWPLGGRKNITLEGVRTTDASRIDVLGQSGEVLEYKPEVVPRTEWRQVEGWLTVNVTRAQRLYNDGGWPNPLVIRITHAERGR